jgi:V/A-type H+-transporting ATPase subunit D
MENVVPTKANLIRAQASLEFSLKGYELLDKKRNVLIREMMGYVDRAKILQERIREVFETAYDALQNANISMGISAVEDIALAIPESTDFSIGFKSVMGVEVPVISYEYQDIKPTYSMIRTNAAMDQVYEKFNEVKYLIYELAEIENSIYKLAMEIKKTQKRANSLQNIQIPKYQELVKGLSEVLEEKERDDFVRLKIVKRKKDRVF